MLAWFPIHKRVAMSKNFLYSIGILVFGMMAFFAIVDVVDGRPWFSPLMPIALTVLLVFFFTKSLKAQKVQKEMRNAADLAANRLIQEELRLVSTGVLPVVSAQNIIVRPGELVHFCMPAALLKNQTVGYSANSAGVSVRVAKGVTLRTGAIKGKAVKGLVPIAQGELALLNTRMIFAGDAKSFETPYGKITHVEKMSNGMTVHVGNSSHMVQIFDAAQASVLHAITDRLLVA